MKISGIMHVHSKYSYDGEMSIKQIKELCKSRGNQFVFIAEHLERMSKKEMENFIYECRTLSERGFLIIPGFEIPTKENLHILGLGIRTFPFKKLALSEAIRKVHEQKGLSILAHPAKHRGAVSPNMIKQVDGIEVWNTLYDNKNLLDFTGFSLFKKLKKEKPNLFAVCGLDMHNHYQFFNMKISLKAESLSEGSIIEKLKMRDYKIKYSFLEIMGNVSKWGEGKVFFIKVFLNLKKIYSMLRK